MDGTWTDVRRRKPPAIQAITNFFVEGFPDGTSKGELRKTFARYGQVVDVYIGGRKDYRKKNYSFVRFHGVREVNNLEKNLQGIICHGQQLEVNLAKHQRKTKGPKIPTFHREAALEINLRYVPHPSSSVLHAHDFRTRTYAQVAKASTTKSTKPLSTPVILNPNTSMKHWIQKTVLIGEAFSLDHIANLPASLLMNENTKYLGGLRIALKFNHSMDATQFLEDNTRWKDWFKKLSSADQVINPFSHIITRRDFSMGNVGVLTTKKRWINETVNIMADGISFMVGVVEYTDDWSPFHPVPFDKVVEESEDEEETKNEDDEDGISDTYMQDDANELEEALPLTKENRDSAINGSNSLLDAMNLKNANGKSMEEAVKVNNVTQNGNTLAAEPNYSTLGEPIGGSTSPGTNIFGPIQDLMSSGCFGPFPNTIPIQFSSPAAHIGDSVSGSESNTSGSKPRKRKKIKTNTRSSPHLTQPILLPNLPIPFPNTQPNRQIDLNANPTVNLTTQSETETHLSTPITD
ncbi:unnamed protein product [Lactuca saligna]|uniref:RRM domain-containing protein n=1 Tax=Lactuca saligna TaxID=75948 RepID=A0AA35ZYL9_LACSI|nr:unnamed protein product [Lactuca saligna]